MENSVSQQLDALVKLQSIDSKLDEIKKLRGDLPEEVQDLEDELEGYNTRLNRFNSELEAFEDNIKQNKAGIKEAEKLIQKYESQQMNVRNNREYDAITKEIELQTLEIQILEKKIKEIYGQIEKKNEDVEATKFLISERQEDLATKKQELDSLMKESEEEERKLGDDRVKASKNIEEKLFKYYERLRKSLTNGLAVVKVSRGAAEGCNIIIPPQKIAEIKERKRIVIDEHSGRILASVEVVEQVEEKPKRTTRRKKA
ncbi:MAG: C4-type zinc ribbon domain-containing protein [Bacteroidota bacterium]